MPGQEALTDAWAEWITTNQACLPLLTIAIALGLAAYKIYSDGKKQAAAHRAEFAALAKEVAEVSERNATRMADAMEGSTAVLTRVATLQDVLMLQRKPK